MLFRSAGGHRDGSSGAPGVPPGVTLVGPRGRPWSRRGSPGWVLGEARVPWVSPRWVLRGARVLNGGHRGGSSGLDHSVPVVAHLEKKLRKKNHILPKDRTIAKGTKVAAAPVEEPGWFQKIKLKIRESFCLVDDSMYDAHVQEKKNRHCAGTSGKLPGSTGQGRYFR